MNSLRISGAYEVLPAVFPDSRGSFAEWFRADHLEATVGHRFTPAQANCSVSASGVIRGIHYSDVPPGQAKYVTCAAGALLDVIVDIRTGSPSFGEWQSVLLLPERRNAVYLSEGLGHAIMALEADTVAIYLCSTVYNPGHEHGVNPLDPALAIQWPVKDNHGRSIKVILSPKDRQAPTLLEAAERDLLPSYAAVQGMFRESSRG